MISTKKLIAILLLPVLLISLYSGVSAVSKAVTQTDTYGGWKYKQQSFTSSGGTFTLEAKLTKLLIYNNPLTMRLSCDTDGNITIAIG